MLKILTSFSFMISMAILLGIVTGGIACCNREISTVAMMIAMIISISSIPLKISRENARKMIIGFVINYVFLTTVILILSIPFMNETLWDGFIIMAAAPPAIAVVPLTRVIKGDVSISLFSLILCYLISIIAMPSIIYIFLAKSVEPSILLQNVFLLIIIPLLVSRFIKIEEEKARLLTNIFFFIAMFAVIGETREYIFTLPSILLTLSIIMAIRTFVTGWGVKKIATKKYGDKVAKSFSLLASFKNEGLVMIFAISMFPSIAALPAIIATIFELIWIFFLEMDLL